MRHARVLLLCLFEFRDSACPIAGAQQREAVIEPVTEGVRRQFERFLKLGRRLSQSRRCFEERFT